MDRDPPRRRTVYFVLLVICAVLSLRPVPSVSAAIELLFVPTRLVAELVAPLTWMRSGEVRAAERRLDEEARRMRHEAAQLLASEQEGALPTDPALLASAPPASNSRNWTLTRSPSRSNTPSR